MNDLLSLSDAYQLSLHAVNLVCPCMDYRLREFVSLL